MCGVLDFVYSLRSYKIGTLSAEHISLHKTNINFINLCARLKD